MKHLGIGLSLATSNPSSIQILVELFPQVLKSALRADQNLHWQLAALDALSIWLLRATRSLSASDIVPHITSSQWENLISISWIRWASAPNSNAIQKTLKDIFSKTLILQRLLFQDWRKREKELLKRVVLMKDVDLKIQCHLIEFLVRRTPNGAREVIESQPNWVSAKLAQMKEGGVGPALGKCVVTVLVVRRTELMSEDEEVYSLYNLNLS